MKKIIIAAVAKNGVIGNGNVLPWHIPEDMKFFRDSTRNQIVVMGRKTLDSLGKPLPHRENAVITRNGAFNVEGVLVFHDLHSALHHFETLYTSGPAPFLFVIGGAQIYREALEWVDEVWLTEIHEEFQGDVFFPDYAHGLFVRNDFERFESVPQGDWETPIRYHFNRYRRKKQN